MLGTFQVGFLGYMVNAQGYFPVPEKVKSIVIFPTLPCLDQLWRHSFRYTQLLTSVVTEFTHLLLPLTKTEEPVELLPPTTTRIAATPPTAYAQKPQ